MYSVVNDLNDERNLMLVLSRKECEKIVIGNAPNAITITVVDIDRGKIRIGIDAPREVPIYRHELLPIVTKPEGKTEA